MARPKDSRSPSDAGSHQSSRRPRRDSDRSDRARGRDGRAFRRRSRSRSPNPRFRDSRDPRDRDGNDRGNRGPGGRDRGGIDRDYYRKRDRSPDRRNDEYYRNRRRDSRERRRSRDTADTRPRSPEHRTERGREGPRDDRRREDSRDRIRRRREGTADSHTRSARDTGDSRRTPPANGNRTRDEKPKPKPAPEKSEATIQAERLARLEAWKKKKANEVQKQKDANPAQTRDLLAEMDRKATDSATVSPGVSETASPAPPGSGSASPAVTYAGKFDPKAIAKKSSTAKSLEKGVLGSPLDVQPDKLAAPQKQMPIASALPSNRAKASAFGFGKLQDADKLPTKRHLDLDEEDDTKRKLTKLPALPDTADDTPYADQDDNDDSEGEEFAENEEEAAAAARALHEKRLQADNEGEKADEEMTEAAPAESEPQINVVQASEQPAAKVPPRPEEQMDVDEEDEVDPLDAFMADLTEKPVKTSTKASKTSKMQEPEAYFSDDEYGVQEDVEDPDAKRLQAIANKRKKKDIPQTDFSKIDMAPIRKNFWVEPAELANLTEMDLTDLRLELDGIKVNGKDVPKPVQKWAHCGLTRATLDVLAELGFEKPTSIQMQAIPTIMSGRDVIGVAKTGSGKTMAFLLPMFRHIKDQPPLKDMDGPVGLIMAPTRELAVQIHRDCKPFLKMMGLRAVCGYGGAPIKDQIAELKRGAEILVCTPGRLIDLLAANQGRVTNLRRVTYVVLDEADRMFDMGFEPQVMKVFNNMRPDKQTILFSATMPRIVDSLTKKVLKSPVEITVGGRSVVAKEIEQIVEIREEGAKFVRVLELLGKLYDTDEDARTLIFVERQEKADNLLKELMTKGYPCMSIHGGKDQVDRDSTISDFKKGVIPILIATSVAARGLDVKQLMLVINYDAPNHLEDYVHRAGRTGRAGNTGVAVTFVTPDQENCALGICKALEQSGQPIPPKLEEMRMSHREKVKSGKAKETSGFGGKGLDRLDQDREAARNRERKTHRAEGDEEEDKEEKKEDDEEKYEKALGAIKAAASGIQARTAASIEAKVSEIKPGREGDSAAGAKDSANNPLDKVSSAVSAINSRLGKAGQLRAGQPIDNKGPDAGAFHATLEINDFPQKARWAVTNRTNVAKILDATGVSITTKGNFYPIGKEVPAGSEPKLYILIEGDTEVAVSSALNDLTRLLRDGTIAAAETDSRAPASGRYTVT